MKLSSFVLALGTFLASTQCFATWIGVFKYKRILVDHIHVSISEHEDFNSATRLNIWSNVSKQNIQMSEEI